MFLALLSIWMALPVGAAEPGPGTLIDGNCADSFTGGLGDREQGPPFGTAAANGRCDSNQNVLTGAQTADVVFGPFTRGDHSMVIGIFDATATSAAGTWGVCLAVAKAYEPPSVPALGSELKIISCSAAITGTVTDQSFSFGSAGVAVNFSSASPANSSSMTAPLPDSFYLLLDLFGGVGHSTPTSATSWTGSASLVWMNN
ncbi:MAG: hypothetical protein WA001_03770 [Patescibacteria group bacterium]